MGGSAVPGMMDEEVGVIAGWRIGRLLSSGMDKTLRGKRADQIRMCSGDQVSEL